MIVLKWVLRRDAYSRSNPQNALRVGRCHCPWTWKDCAAERVRESHCRIARFGLTWRYSTWKSSHRGDSIISMKWMLEPGQTAVTRPVFWSLSSERFGQLMSPVIKSFGEHSHQLTQDPDQTRSRCTLWVYSLNASCISCLTSTDLIWSFCIFWIIWTT